MNGARFSHILGDILEKINATKTAMTNQIICLKNMAEPAVEKIIASPIRDRIIAAAIMSRSSLFGMMNCVSLNQERLHDFSRDRSSYTGSMPSIFDKHKYQNLWVITRRKTNK